MEDGTAGRVCVAGAVDGEGRAWKRTGWRRGMGDGRGNLRENREDPAPTVGRWRGCHCDPIVTPLPQPCAYHAPRMPPPMGTLRFLHNDAPRRAATVFEKWNCLIETYLHVRGENPPKNEPMRAFRRGSPFGIRRFKTDSPVSSEDVATRCAASLSSIRRSC